MIRWQEQYSPEERRVTREIIGIIAELPDDLCVRDLVRGDALHIPEEISGNLRGRIEALAPYLLWAAGKEANVWLSGGPAYFPEAA